MRKDNFFEKFQDFLGPIAAKLNENRYISAVKDGFSGIMSILIVGSFFLLMANLPLDAYTNFMASIFGDNWAEFFRVPYRVTMNIMTLYVIVGIAKSLSKRYKLNDLSSIVWSMVALLILTPPVLGEDGLVLGIPFDNLSANGLFLGILTTIFTVEIIRWVYNRGWKIKMPDSVPQNIATSFEVLIPGIFVAIIFNFIRLGFAATSFETAQGFIFGIIQRPLTAVGASLWATVFIEMIPAVLFAFGIHGPNIVAGIMNPIWYALSAENLEAFASGMDLPNIVNQQFHNSFIKLGGAGSTIGLAILTVFRAKSSQFKTIGKLSIVPSLFNINEPLIFGLPIVLNPILIIPFVLMPAISVLLTYFVMYIGLVPIANGTAIPWTTPPIISGLLLAGWRGALFQLFLGFVSIAVYYPFFKMEDAKAYEKDLLLEK